MSSATIPFRRPGRPCSPIAGGSDTGTARRLVADLPDPLAAGRRPPSYASARFGRRNRAFAGPRAGEAKLAERFAAGEIDRAGVPRALAVLRKRHDDRPRTSTPARTARGGRRGPRADQAVRRRHRRRRHQPHRAARARSTGSSGRTAPARRRRCACCSAWSRPPPAPSRCSAAAPGDPAALARIGSLVEGPAFYPYLSGRDNMRVVARYAGVPPSRVGDVLETVDLADRARDRFATYSLGMKQRLGVAAALLKDPELVVLDEPTNGLDPAGMRDMRRLVRELGSGRSHRAAVQPPAG